MEGGGKCVAWGMIIRTSRKYRLRAKICSANSNLIEWSVSVSTSALLLPPKTTAILRFPPPQRPISRNFRKTKQTAKSVYNFGFFLATPAARPIAVSSTGLPAKDVNDFTFAKSRRYRKSFGSRSPINEKAFLVDRRGQIYPRPLFSEAIVNGGGSFWKISVSPRLLNVERGAVVLMQNLRKRAQQQKSLAQGVRQKNDISERRSKVWRGRGRNHLRPLLCLRHVRWVTVRLVRGHLTPKMNIRSISPAHQVHCGGRKWYDVIVLHLY